MHKSELAADPDLGIPQIPVICDKCRETGMAGDEAFSAVPDILNFTPVQRRAHANGWREEHQRAFIAALAITGSPRQAARAIGKHAFGAEQLRDARNGKSFAAAWDAAMELARERETHRIHDSLKDLAAKSSQKRGRGPSQAVEGPHQIHPDCPYDPEIHTADYPEYWESHRRIRMRLTMARRLLLFLLADDEEKRRAWETLCGPTDWDRAERREPQDDEPFFDPDYPESCPSMTRPDMLLTAEAGLLPDLCGGHDAIAEHRAKVQGEEGSPELRQECEATDGPRSEGSDGTDVTDSPRDGLRQTGSAVTPPQHFPLNSDRCASGSTQSSPRENSSPISRSARCRASSAVARG